MSEALAVERQGPLGLVTMNRPERHNAFDDALIAELTEAFRSMEAEDGVRIVVLSGAGKSFSAGADLNWMRRMAGFSMEENRRDAMGLAALMRTIAHLRKPTIARVQGARAARRYFLTAERFDAAEAWRLGLVHEIAATEPDMDESIGVLVDAMLAASPAAQKEAKDLIRAVANRPLTSEVVQDTAERIARIRSSPEGREGVSAFLEKRRASWVPPDPEPEIPPESPGG